MTEKEMAFVEKFGEFVVAAREMENEGNMNIVINIKLTSYKNYTVARQTVDLELKRKFLENGYALAD